MSKVKVTDGEIEDFVGYLRSSGREYSDETVERYVHHLQRIAAVVKPQTLKDFNEQDWRRLNTWLMEDKKSWSYNYGLKTALKVYWSDCLHYDLRKKKPWFLLPNKKSFASVEKTHDREQYKEKMADELTIDFKKIYTADLTKNKPNADKDVAARDKVMFITNYFAAARRGEIHRMQVEDIDFENHMLTIRDSKGRSIVAIPITEDKFWSVLHGYTQALGLTTGPLFVSSKTGKALNKDTISRRISVVGEQVYGRHMWSHFLRYFRSSLLGNILPPEQLQRFVRHKDMRTTMQYYRSRGMIDREMLKNLKKKTGDLV